MVSRAKALETCTCSFPSGKDNFDKINKDDLKITETFPCDKKIQK